MQIGDCPHDDCNGITTREMPERTPVFELVQCPSCRRDVWLRLSRVDPHAWTFDQFLTEHHIDHETKTIIRCDGRPLHNAGTGELAAAFHDPSYLQNALKQLVDDFANSIWKKSMRMLIRRWVAPSRAHQKRYHRNPKRRALRK